MKSHPNQSLTAPSLTDAVYRSIRADLLACRVQPGQRLKIADLARDTGSSLGAVREALSRLTSEGLVIAEPQRGFRAAPISAEELIDLTEVRIAIETMCVRRAMAAGDLRWETELLVANHMLLRTPRMDATDPSVVSEDWAKAHHRFHEAVVAACDSPKLLQIRDQLYAQSERYRRLSVPLDESGRDLDAEHKAITDALLARDADAACAAISDHLHETTHILLEAQAKLLKPAPAAAETP